jgi:hypothetical protein
MIEARPTPQLRYFWRWQDESGITKALQTMHLCQQALDLAASKIEKLKHSADSSIDDSSTSTIADSSDDNAPISKPTAVQQLSLF